MQFIQHTYKLAQTHWTHLQTNNRGFLKNLMELDDVCDSEVYDMICGEDGYIIEGRRFQKAGI